MSVFGAGFGVSPRTLHPGYPAGSALYMTQSGLVAGTVSAVDVLYLYPFVLYSPVTVAAFGIRCTAGGAGSAVKAGIWTNNPVTGRPTGTPVISHNAGFDTTTNGVKALTGLSVRLPAGVYWGGGKVTGTIPTLHCAPSNSFALNWVSTTGGISSAANVVALQVADAYANNISAFDATSASFTPVNLNAPIMILEFA